MGSIIAPKVIKVLEGAHAFVVSIFGSLSIFGRLQTQPSRNPVFNFSIWSTSAARRRVLIEKPSLRPRSEISIDATGPDES